MKLPQRVPWRDTAELKELYDIIYSDQGDVKLIAINKLLAWQATTTLPQALESSLSLLTVMADDSKGQHSSSLALRHGYAIALVRMVNAVVDPLQVGAYARSIASIASQIGLPVWLVELRHAATHEELPSLDFLRQGAAEALRWLAHKFFLPILVPATSENPAIELPPLEPWLREYKSFSKSIARDESTRARHSHDLLRLRRDLERWIGRVKSLSHVEAFSSSQAEAQEQFAMQSLSKLLIGKGGLVPVSKSKRDNLAASDTPTNVSIWSDLILVLHRLHPAFVSIVISCIVDALLWDDQLDVSYQNHLASWASWLIDQMPDDQGTIAEDNLSRIYQSGMNSEALEIVRSAFQIVSAHSGSVPREALWLDAHETVWEDKSLDEMQERLSVLKNTVAPPAGVGMDDPGQRIAALNKLSEDPLSETGWLKLESGVSWRSCPLGSLSGLSMSADMAALIT